ncbi:signal peptide peptidase SppA [Candidatus Micrarchaeota archaeon]|nr:MAG: signal peptide peptidase SppA [Candidatus Micrarchaeota archaeon]
MKLLKKKGGLKGRDLVLIIIIAVAGLMLIGIPILLAVAAAVMPEQPCVGVVKISGAIVTESPGGFGSEGLVSSDEFTALMKDVQSRDEIKALLFEINSPGGSVVASSEMYNSINEIDKPKVMFFREVAASGGYYVAMAGDRIISDPNTLTGSIGARMTLMELSELFDDLGINYTNIVSGEYKDMGDISRPLTDEEREILQTIVDEVFADFRQIVIDGRSGRPNFSIASFDEIADGRILTGRQALDYGLVDELGTKQDALESAAQMGSIEVEEGEEIPVCELSTESGLFELLFASSANALSQIISQALDLANQNDGMQLQYR